MRTGGGAGQARRESPHQGGQPHRRPEDAPEGEAVRDEIENLTLWVARGGVWPDSGNAARTFAPTEKQRRWWAFQPGRRLLERGVRFVQLFDAPANNAWEHRGGLRENLPKRCAAVDRPIAALLTDQKARGLLEDTLVLWGGEFGRTPTAEGSDGREHHPFGFSMWLAGGGIRGGMVHGETDEFGWFAVEKMVHVHDLHATILHLMGLDHERLTYRFGRRDYRLTDVHGHVMKDILA